MKDKDYKYSLTFKLKNTFVSYIMLFAMCGFFVAFYIKGMKVMLLPILAFAGLIIYSLYKHIFIKILIYDNGFSHQTSPFKKEFFEDAEIEDAWISEKRNSNGTTAYYFNYKARDGRKGKYYFPPNLYDYADYLVNRIKGEDVSEYERHLDN